MLKNHLWKSEIFVKAEDQWPINLLKMSLFRGYFSVYVASENQLPDFSLIGILVQNRLICFIGI